MRWIKYIALICVAVLSYGCTDKDRDEDFPNNVVWTEKVVAVVLPMEKGLDRHWRRTADMFASNFKRAFVNQSKGIKFKFEYYDESTADIPALARQLAMRDEVFAVVGGLYSSNAAPLASTLTRMGKTFFTLATTEELVRAYASTGYLWAMTETDITQCEVLLSKVVNYGGKSVALIAKENDSYGQTFVNWFAFQAKELGLENRGAYLYDDVSLGDACSRAMHCGAEYVVCVPSEIEDISQMLASYDITPRSNAPKPRLLFSDTGYGADVPKILGSAAEGMEGVAFGADPESGFDVSYHTFFGEQATLGESQFYDALMLIGYGAWYCQLQEDVPLYKALRQIVSGRDTNMGSWMGEDMSLVVDALAQGKSPDIRGASGHLDFDAKVFTNVLSTTYYSYKIYNGQYIILDYNTSDGGNRTDATLAGWNWKASQMQDFSNSTGLSYAPHTGNKALLVASSRAWINYRHQADVLAIYQVLKTSGYTDDDIILIAEDDLATHASNPTQGMIPIAPGGRNLYENVTIDYKMSSLTADDVCAILRGEKSERLPTVFDDTGQGDNIFVFWSGHGVPGALCWGEDPFGLTGDKLAATLQQMATRRSYRKLLMMVEACYSGGVMSPCAGLPGMLFITAANADETSKADVFSDEYGVWMSNRFTSTFINQISADRATPMRELYYRLFINTVGSHVMVYNADNYDNLYKSNISEFINLKQ